MGASPHHTIGRRVFPFAIPANSFRVSAAVLVDTPSATPSDLGCATLSRLSLTSNLRNLSNLRILTSAPKSELNGIGPASGWSALIFFAVLLLSMAALTGLNFFTGFFRLYPAVAVF